MSDKKTYTAEEYQALHDQMTAAAELRSRQDKARAALDSTSDPALKRALAANRAKVVADLDAHVNGGAKDPVDALAKSYAEYAALFGAPAQADAPAKPADAAPAPSAVAAAVPLPAHIAHYASAQAPTLESLNQASSLTDVLMALRSHFAAEIAQG